MSKADKMFEELGYKKGENELTICYSIFLHRRYRLIKFYLDKKRCRTDVNIGIEEHLAISEKMKELGWIK